MEACARQAARPVAGSQFCLGGGSRTISAVILALIGMVLLGLVAGPVFAAPSQRHRLQSVRLAPADGGAQQVELRLSGAATYRVFTLTRPDRVVMDVANAAVGPAALPLPAGTGLVRQVRAAHRGDGSLRLVFDSAEPLRAEARLTPDPAGARVVLFLGAGRAASLSAVPQPARLAAAKAPDMAASATIPPVPPPASVAMPASPQSGAGADAPAPGVPVSVESPRAAVVAPRPAGARPIVIAVDPGHGGHDPGARGPSGALEKDVTLAIAKRLVARINAEPDMRAMLTRRGDQFVVLRQRMERARAANADLFVSIHADAVQNRAVRGATVYVLNEKGATDEAARRLAARENAADLIGGVHLGDKDPVLASVLMDLSQNAALSSSIAVGDAILEELARVGVLLRPSVQQAPFMVLKSPDVPSVLVETAFISNATDERNLRSSGHQDRLATAILAGIRSYFAANPPRGTLLADRR